MSINYEYYRIFYHVAKHRNLTQAAAALMSNQPNITRTIRLLENELGCTLFVRSNRGVSLTPEGEKLYDHVRIAVEQLEMGEEQLSMDRTLQSGFLSIGVSEVALQCFLLPVLKEYHRLYPGVRMRILNQPTPEPIGALKNGSVDLAVVTTPTGDTKSLRVQKIMDYRETAVCGGALKKLAQGTLTLDELARYSIISLGPRTKTHELYCGWFARNGLSFAPDIEVATAAQILPMVENNLGIGFVPEGFLRGKEADDIYRLRLSEPVPARAVCLMKRSDQPLGMAARTLERMIMESAQACPGGER